MGTTETTVVTGVKKYWKILLSVAIVAFIFAVYFIGQCNGKKNANPAPADTLNTYIKKIESQNVVLLSQIATLTKLKAKDSLNFIAELNDQSHIQYIYVHTQDSARKLPLTGAVRLMALNLKDTAKGKINIQMSAKDTVVCMPHQDVYNVNSEFITANYLQKDNNDLKKEVSIELNKDSLNNVIIGKYKGIVKNDSTVTNVLQTENNTLTTNLKKMTSKFKRQRFFKDVFEGTTLVAIIWAALK